MSKICPETNDTVLSQDCVECETKLCRTKTQPPDNMINMDKKSNGTVKNTGEPELRL